MIVTLISNLTKYFIVGTFCASVLFAILYGPLFNWQGTVTGRATFILDLSIAGALLHFVLLIWGVRTTGIKPGSADGISNLGPWYDAALTWFSVISIAIAGISIIILIWQLLRVLAFDPQTKLAKRLLKPRITGWLLKQGRPRARR
jgi:hypothetical protein